MCSRVFRDILAARKTMNNARRSPEQSRFEELSCGDSGYSSGTATLLLYMLEKCCTGTPMAWLRLRQVSAIGDPTRSPGTRAHSAFKFKVASPQSLGSALCRSTAACSSHSLARTNPTAVSRFNLGLASTERYLLGKRANNRKSSTCRRP